MAKTLSFDSDWWDNQHNMHESSPAVWPLEKVFEDDVLMVINKPAGLSVQTDHSGTVHLLEAVQASHPRQTFYLVHRLDRPVCGLVVLAKSARVQTDLTRQMASHRFSKIYRAIVSPGPESPSGLLENYLVKHQGHNRSRVVDSQDPAIGKKLARLSYHLQDTTCFSCTPYSLLEIALDTGRHHQIRVQLSHAGWPIVNDAKYGGLLLDQKPGRLALQACRIDLIHPVGGQQMVFRIAPPDFPPWTLFSSVTDVL